MEERFMFLRKLFIAVLFLFAALPARASDIEDHAHERTVAYNIDIFEIDDVPGHPELVSLPVDINNKGRVVSTVTINNLQEALVSDGPTVRRRKPPILAICAPASDTLGSAINNRVVIGTCGNRDLGKEVGFVKSLRGGGGIQLVDFPGSVGTRVFGLAQNGLVFGQFNAPFVPGTAPISSNHGFVWDPSPNRYREIDFPAPDTFVNCVSGDNQGRAVCEYIIVTVTNEPIEHGWFTWDNGNVTNLNLPSLEFIGGKAQTISDSNESE